jgi:hypothetical protein
MDFNMKKDSFWKQYNKHRDKIASMKKFFIRSLIISFTKAKAEFPLLESISFVNDEGGPLAYTTFVYYDGQCCEIGKYDDLDDYEELKLNEHPRLKELIELFQNDSVMESALSDYGFCWCDIEYTLDQNGLRKVKMR